MGFLAEVHQRGTWRGPFSLKDPALAELYGYGARSLAGPVVTELTAFMCAAFWSGVDQISSDTAKQPLNLLKRLAGGGSEPYLDSRTYKLLKFRPNPETGSFMFRKTLIAHALVYGNGYAEIVRDGVGRPSALWTLHPNRVQPFYEEQKDRNGTVTRKPLKYRIDGEVVLDPLNVLHLAGLSDDAVVGYNLVSIAREALGMALASQQFLSAFFGNGTRFGGVLSSDQELDDQQKEEVRQAVEKIHAKADKAFRLLVLGAGFKYEASGVKPSDAQMTEIRDQQVTEIARFLNMPLHKLKLNTPGTVSYASVEMADLDYYKGPILTWSTASEEELNAKLISPLEWGRQYFKHNSNVFLRGDIKSRYEALGIAHDRGIINANEWRELEDQNPQAGDQGNLYFIQSGFIPKNKSEELVDSQIKKNDTSPAPPNPPSGGDTGRAERAEALAAEALAKYHEEREARVAAEAVSTANESEIAERRKAEEQALARATTLETLAAELRKQAVADAALTSAAEAARVVSEAELAATRARAEQAETSATAARQDADKATAIVGQLVAELEGVKAAREQAVADAEAAKQLAAEAEARGHAADDMTREAGELRALADIAAQEQRRLEAAVVAADAASREALARAAALEVDLAAVRAQAATDRAATIARLSAVISAHRALVVDVVTRLGEREIDRARSRQQSPEKMRAWIETFYGPFHDQFVEAILPAVRVHLAWKLSTDDPRDVAVAMSTRYCEESKAQLRAFLNSTPDDFHVAVDHLLRRWEKDRPNAIADALLAEEIAHLRELERQP